MLDRAAFDRIRARKEAASVSRREIIKLASDALNASKRAIFALHRGDTARADALLAEADASFARIRERIATEQGSAGVGAYRAALEEFAEATLYRGFVERGTVGELDYPDMDDDAYLGGLCDLAGELQRRQVMLATAGDTEGVTRMKDAIAEIVEALLDLDLEGPLRVKFDQAKNALRRAEDVLYDVTIRRA